MLEKECKRLGYDTKILLKSDKLKDVSAQLRLENEENLMATIGYGGITLNSVMSKLVELYKKEQKLTTTKDLSQLLAELKPRRSKAKSSHGILVKGEEALWSNWRAAVIRFRAIRLSGISPAAAVFRCIAGTAPM